MSNVKKVFNIYLENYWLLGVIICLIKFGLVRKTLKQRLHAKVINSLNTCDFFFILQIMVYHFDSGRKFHGCLDFCQMWKQKLYY